MNLLGLQFVCLLATVSLLQSAKGASIKTETYQIINRENKHLIGHNKEQVVEIDVDYENHATNDDKVEYDEAEGRGDSVDCKCRNGGSCALDNDFCVCPNDFTGRLCEIRMEKDNRLGCGHLINGESEFLECAVCKCTRNMLTCSAIANTACNLKLMTQSDRMDNKMRAKLADIDGTLEQLKGADLLDLLQLVTSIENYAYENYINEYRNRHLFRVFYRDLSSHQRGPLGSTGTDRHNGLPILNHKKNGKDNEIPSPSSNHLIVLRSGNKIMGIYFNQITQVVSSSSRLRFDFFIVPFFFTFFSNFF